MAIIALGAANADYYGGKMYVIYSPRDGYVAQNGKWVAAASSAATFRTRASADWARALIAVRHPDVVVAEINT
jgi:hypothetical protein